MLNIEYWGLGIGDWGLGIGPIPNPQSPIPIDFHLLLIITILNFQIYMNRTILFKNTPLLGIEPRISSLGGKRLIHWATGV